MMLQNTPLFSSFSVHDLSATKDFYQAILGLEVTEDAMGLNIRSTNGTEIFVYQKDTHEPASFTILNFIVKDIDAMLRKLQEHGVAFECYEDMQQDSLGVARGKAAGMGPDIAWFKDPSGNILAILEP